MAAIGKPAKPMLMRFGLLGILLSRWSFRHLKYTNLSIGDDFIYINGIFISSLSSHQGGSGITSNIISGRLIGSVRHLVLQNPSNISDSFERVSMVQQYPI